MMIRKLKLYGTTHLLPKSCWVYNTESKSTDELYNILIDNINKDKKLCEEYLRRPMSMEYYLETFCQTDGGEL